MMGKEDPTNISLATLEANTFGLKFTDASNGGNDIKIRASAEPEKTLIVQN